MFGARGQAWLTRINEIRQRLHPGAAVVLVVSTRQLDWYALLDQMRGEGPSSHESEATIEAR